MMSRMRASAISHGGVDAQIGLAALKRTEYMARSLVESVDYRVITRLESQPSITHPVRCTLRHGGEMPRGGHFVTMAERLRVPGLRRADLQ